MRLKERKGKEMEKGDVIQRSISFGGSDLHNEFPKDGGFDRMDSKFHKKKHKKKKKDPEGNSSGTSSIGTEMKSKKRKKMEKDEVIEISLPFGRSDLHSEIPKDGGFDRMGTKFDKKKHKKKKDPEGNSSGMGSIGTEMKSKKRKKMEKDKVIERSLPFSRSDLHSEVPKDGGFDRMGTKFDKKKHKKKKDPEVDSSGTCSIGTKMKSKKRRKMKKDEVVRRSPYLEYPQGSDLHNEALQDGDFNKKKHKRKKKDPKGNSATVASRELSQHENSRTRPEPKLANGGKSNDDVAEILKDSQPGGIKKKVRFANDVEVFPIDDRTKLPKVPSKVGLIRGKRFTKEEDQMINESVSKYLADHNLGSDGLHMVLTSAKYPEVRGCWNEIAAAIPWRPKIAVYKRATVLFRSGGDKHKWTPEELEVIRRHYELNGPKWKDLADVIGRHRIHIKDAWRRNKLPNMNKGKWHQEEYNMLYDLVNLDLRMKAFEVKDSKHGMLKDNISWSAISDKISTRSSMFCCIKWYNTLSSSMVEQGLWSDCDDYLLVDALRNLDACCAEDVDWDHLLEHRTGEVCRKRWMEMGKQLDGYREKSFMEQVDVLSTRYPIEIREYRNRTNDDEENEEEEEE